MNNDCNIKNPLFRDGTSQQQRLLNALLPSYVSVDERSMDDLIKFAADYSAEIKYYALNNTVNGDWSNFFKNQVIDRTNQRTQAHYALFLAFLEMFKILQNDLNTITQRHLEFYYKDVLRIKEREAIPDQVFVIFGLAKGAVSASVSKETALDGGDDATGAKRVYNTSKNLVVNNAQVKELKALFYNKANDHRIYASPIANSEDGRGAEIIDEEKKWKTFGAINNPSETYSAALVGRDAAKTGFAFSSPLLLMSEGTRYVTIKLTLNSVSGLNNTTLAQAFKMYFSGQDDWIEPEDNGGSIQLDGNSIEIVRVIHSGQPAVAPYNKKNLKEELETTYPVFKILLNSNADSFIYNTLKGIKIRKADIKVDVKGVKNLVLQNDTSNLDSGKPFQPFGSRPVIGSNFYVGSNEVFSKRLSSVNVNIHWKGLPSNPGGFQEYYHDYLPSSVLRKSHDFKVNVSILDKRTWSPLLYEGNDEARLFYAAPLLDKISFSGDTNSSSSDSDSNSKYQFSEIPGLKPTRTISIAGGGLNGINWDYASALNPPDEYTSTTRRGFIRLQLANVDFGHNDFQFSFATQAIKAAAEKVSTVNQTNTTVTENGQEISTISGTISDTASSNELKKLPNQPYTPEIAELSLDYSASSTINFEAIGGNSENAFIKRLDQFFHLEAFGCAERHPYLQTGEASLSLLPNYSDEGSLFVGLRDAVPGNIVSILFKTAEGTSNPELLKQPLKWSYLTGNRWKPFGSSQVLSDSTNSFLSSGIVELELPADAGTANTLMTKGLHWIKVAVFENSFSACQMIDVKTQAVAAVFSDNSNDPNHLSLGLPPGNITRFVNSLNGVKDVIQPYAAFGGKMREANEQFYTRVSERLRHKNRAVTIWDYERLVLDKFPAIYKTKCVNHAKIVSPVNYNLVLPGNISMLVISNVRNKNAVNPLKPTTSLLVLDEVKQYLLKLSSGAVKIHASNPIYEEVKVSFSVKFMTGYDSGYYSKILNDEIKMFLAPWAYEVKDVSFGGTVHRSAILNFVEEREYVDYVTVFRMDHHIADKVYADLAEVNASTPASVLTSATQHEITVLAENDMVPDSLNLVNMAFAPVDDNCDCDDTPSQSTAGINFNAVGVNFVVGGVVPFGNEGLGLMEIDENFSID